MRLALSRFCAFLLVLTVALPWVHAGDDETPAPKKDEPAPKAEPAPRGEVRPAPAPPGGMTRKDIEELVRRGGRLPEGFIPHGWRFDEGDGPKKPTGSIHRDMPFPMPGGGAMEGALAQATGKLILKYLEEKDDPARAAIYEELLREIGKALAEGKGETFAAHVPRVMGRLMGGLADPKKAPVYREIMKIFGEAMAGGLTAPQEPADPPRPPPIISGVICPGSSSPRCTRAARRWQAVAISQ